MKSAISVTDVVKRFRYLGIPKQTTLKETVVKRLQGESHSRRSIEAIAGVSFSVPSGKALGIVGRNGSGKTTLLRLLAGVYVPDEGRIAINGSLAPLLSLAAGFHPDLTGRENARIELMVLGFSPKQIQQRMDKIVAFAEIGDFIDAPMRTYSSGMMLRLAFAAAISVDPDVLLLDEVLAVGDAPFAEKCLRCIDDFRARGKTIVLVTHSMEMVRARCDIALWLDRGKIAAFGNPLEVTNAYEHAARKEPESFQMQPQAAPKTQVPVQREVISGNGAQSRSPKRTRETAKAIPDLLYRSPQDLMVTHAPLRRVMVIGQCLMSAWPEVIEGADDGCPCDFLLFNNALELPQSPPHPINEYDFQLVQIPLRSVLPESEYFRVSFSDTAAYEKVFQESKERLSQFLATAMRWNADHGLLTFVANFLIPQQNPMGRLLPRYDLRNFVYFIEKLNEALAEEVGRYHNAHVFDFDQVVSTYGRKHFQDDALLQINHNGALTDGDFELDQQRLEPAGRASAYYPVKTHLYLLIGWAELLALYRTIRGVDMVKMVVVDIDDTLWRGVAAERTETSAGAAVEGWPLGMAEALGHLKRRGILLAIVSKNDEKLAAQAWEDLLGSHRLSLEDFAIRKINWRAKIDNFEEILQEANLLPHSVVYIDDNPVERESIKLAFPGVRVFGPTPLLWRRILLWSAETQVPIVTSESAARTEMVHAQIKREEQRKQLSREDFLSSLSVEVSISELDGVAHPGFARALELINKTNQYNTTGRRWTWDQCAAAFANGMRLFTFGVKDRFTKYGTVGVVIVDGSEISQFVMSCRVVGMEVEIAVMAEVLRVLDNLSTVSGTTGETELNLLARDLYERCGFKLEEGRWTRALIPPLERPAHVKTTVTVRADSQLETAE